MKAESRTPRDFLANLTAETVSLRNKGLYKEEYRITSPQQAFIMLED